MSKTDPASASARAFILSILAVIRQHIDKIEGATKAGDEVAAHRAMHDFISAAAEIGNGMPGWLPPSPRHWHVLVATYEGGNVVQVAATNTYDSLTELRSALAEHLGPCCARPECDTRAVFEAIKDGTWTPGAGEEWVNTETGIVSAAECVGADAGACERRIRDAAASLAPYAIARALCAAACSRGRAT